MLGLSVVFFTTLLRAVRFHRIGAKTDISMANISKTLQLAPQQSRCINSTIGKIVVLNSPFKVGMSFWKWLYAFILHSLNRRTTVCLSIWRAVQRTLCCTEPQWLSLCLVCQQLSEIWWFRVTPYVSVCLLDKNTSHTCGSPPLLLL